MIGGELRATSRALVGPLTRLLLDELRVDRALMGTFALSLEDGLTTTDPSEAYTKELVMRRAREVDPPRRQHARWEPARSSAPGASTASTSIVTDAGIDERLVRSLTRRGIRVIAA